MAPKKKSKPEASVAAPPAVPACETHHFLHRGTACTACGAKRAR